jgi:ATP-dependent DNA helicase RecG
VDLQTLRGLIEDLRAEGSDTSDVEAKAARNGFPESLAPTLSAFGNRPGGGVVLLGLDENRGFAATGVYDVAACKSALASLARQGVEPPLVVEIDDIVIEGASIVVGVVQELPAAVKPCRVRRSGRAYLRAYDGDYELAETEEQSFLTHRETPRFDQQPAHGARREDLDSVLVDDYLRNCRVARGALSQFDDEEILFRTGATTGDDRIPTVAGLLALGIYPQQFYPNYVIQAYIPAGTGDSAGIRALDSRVFDGPLPVILERALSWVQSNTRTRIRFGEDGHGRDEPEYPADAVRELIANALVHRDLGPHALGEAVTLRLEPDRLVLSNPGGLWGLKLDRLGRTGVTSARNGWLLRMCQNIRFGADRRIVEALATGIPIVLRSLAKAGMAPPSFHDQAVRFTVRIPNYTLLDPGDLEWLASLPATRHLGDLHRHALVAMHHGATWTNRSFREAFPMDARDALAIFAALADTGLVEAVGERGGRVYRLAGQSSPVAKGSKDIPPGHRAAGARNRNAVLDVLRGGARTVAELAAATGLSPRQVNYMLVRLRDEGIVVLRGGPGAHGSRYELAGGD